MLGEWFGKVEVRNRAVMLSGDGYHRMTIGHSYTRVSFYDAAETQVKRCTSVGRVALGNMFAAP